MRLCICCSLFKNNIIATSKGYGVTGGKAFILGKRGQRSNNEGTEQSTCFYISGTEKRAHLIKVN